MDIPFSEHVSNESLNSLYDLLNISKTAASNHEDSMHRFRAAHRKTHSKAMKMPQYREMMKHFSNSLKKYQMYYDTLYDLAFVCFFERTEYRDLVREMYVHMVHHDEHLHKLLQKKRNLTSRDWIKRLSLFDLNDPDAAQYLMIDDADPCDDKDNDSDQFVEVNLND